MVRPMETPWVQAVVRQPARITGLLSTASGRNGSGARSTHQMNAALMTAAAMISPTICCDSHG